VPGPVKVRLCFHNHCFDGAASSAVFLRFYQSRIQTNSEFHFTGMAHRASGLFDADTFDGDENAIVDFKYSSSPRVTWWFDHHQSAFLTPADAENFRHDASGKKFYDPNYKSCTKLIADIAGKKFGFDSAPLAELIHWGDIIDGAQYPTPESAVEMREPATQLAMVIEAAPDSGLPARLIPEMAVKPLAEIVRLPMVAQYLGPLLERHKRCIEILRERSVCSGGVIFFDVSDLDFEGYNKFIPYLLYRDAIYSVGVSASPSRTKISLGSNPWNPRAVEKNLASLAETYGGGGHPRVAAISLDPGDIERARQIARDIAAQLRD
jgi:hypothetical protein